MSSIQLKGKGKNYPRTGHEGAEEELYSCIISLTWALGGDGWVNAQPP